jgi:Zn-dependent protease
MRGSTKIFRIFGIDIKLHYSWWFIFIFITLALTFGFFPQRFPGYSNSDYWTMGVLASILLFTSVLLHELSHSLVARMKKIKVESITLFFFGGVAGITKEDMKPSSEFMMAIAGPLFSFFLAGIFYLIIQLNLVGIIKPVVYYLFVLNFIVAIFNLIPAFPLDGGRVLRALLNWKFHSLKKATFVAAKISRFIALIIIFYGIMTIFYPIEINGFYFGGLWFALIGAFLYFIAGVSYEQVIIKEILSPIPVTEIIDQKIVSINGTMKFSAFVNKYSKSSHGLFLITGKNKILDINRVNQMPLKLQKVLTVSQAALDFPTKISIKDNAYQAFRKLGKFGYLPVFSGKKFMGVITQRTIRQRLLWEMKFRDHGIKTKKFRITHKNQ